jgi:hypothetical protein
MSANYDISIIQGDSFRWAMYLDNGGTAYDLSGCTLSMQLRKGYYPSTLVASYVINVPTGFTGATMPEGMFGGLCASATGGTIYVSIGATHTSQLTPNSTPKYDLQIVNPVGNTVTTILRGTIEVLDEVTRL